MNKNYFFGLILIAVVFILVNSSTDQPVAVIFDSLGPSETLELSQVLTDEGYRVTRYTGNKATISNFKKIPHDSDLVIFRVHSSVDHGKVWLFTAEQYSEEKYPVDQLINGVHRARTNSTGEYFFAISSNFFKDYTPGLDGSIVLVLGCDAAVSNDLADVFLEKGASSYTSWNGPVSLEHTDKVFNDIVFGVAHGMTIETAMKKALDKHGVDPYFNSTLLCIKQ